MDPKPSPGYETIADEIKAAILGGHVFAGIAKDVLFMRFGVKGYAPRTRLALAALMGITEERITQIELKAIKKMRNQNPPPNSAAAVPRAPKPPNDWSTKAPFPTRGHQTEDPYMHESKGRRRHYDGDTSKLEYASAI